MSLPKSSHVHQQDTTARMLLLSQSRIKRRKCLLQSRASDSAHELTEKLARSSARYNGEDALVVVVEDQKKENAFSNFERQPRVRFVPFDQICSRAPIVDDASAQLAIALQLHDLDELEASGTADKLVICLQREQLKIDAGFDASTFEANATFNRLTPLNHQPLLTTRLSDMLL